MESCSIPRAREDFCFHPAVSDSPIITRVCVLFHKLKFIVDFLFNSRFKFYDDPVESIIDQQRLISALRQ